MLKRSEKCLLWGQGMARQGDLVLAIMLEERAGFLRCRTPAVRIAVGREVPVQMCGE